MKPVLIVLGLLLLPHVARASDVGVVMTGDAPEMQPKLQHQIETWLQSHGHTLVPTPLPPDAINTLTDCFVIEDQECARKVIEGRGRAEVIVYARVAVTGEGVDKTVTVTAYWFERGHKAVSVRRSCERCTEATLASTAVELMSALVQAAPHTTGRIKITSDPAGASCQIDGKPAGPTPLESELAPGPHEVTVVREHHTTATKSVVVKAGEVSEVDVRLVRVPPSRLLPMVTMGVGGALLATGIVMVAIDQDKGRNQPLFIRNTGPAGVAIGVVGLAVGAGGYVWYRMTGQQESHPVATVGSSGTTIGWAGRF